MNEERGQEVTGPGGDGHSLDDRGRVRCKACVDREMLTPPEEHFSPAERSPAGCL